MRPCSVALLTALFASLIAAQCTLAQNVGVSPGSIDLGLLEPGSTKVVDFYIVTSSNETLLIDIEPETAIFDLESITENTSEENMVSWVEMVNNPVELEPNTESQILGGSISGQRQVSFLLEIPKEAEPGRHVLNIKPVPLSSAESMGAVGGMVVAITSIKINFDVSGDPLRSGTILDVEGGSNVNGKQEIKTYFQNTGNVTISAGGTQKVYNKDGDLVAELYLGNTYVKPKEIKTLRSYLKTDDIPFEEYSVYTLIDYMTGTAEMASAIELTPATSLVIEQGPENLLWVALILVIVAVSIIIYRRLK